MKRVTIDCYEKNFKDTEMSLFRKEWYVRPDIDEYVIHLIDTGKDYKYTYSKEFDKFFIVTD